MVLVVYIVDDLFSFHRSNNKLSVVETSIFKTLSERFW